MRRKITTIAAAMAMSAMMAMSAFASNYSGTYFYFNAAQTAAAPSHAQACVTGVETEEGDEAGTTNIIVHVQEIQNGGVTGAIKSITIDGVKANSDGETVIFDGVDNSLINDKGLVEVSVNLSYGGHPVDLSDIYLDIEQ